MKGLKLQIQTLTALDDEIRIFLSDNPFDILAINESKIDSSIRDSEIHINNYSIIRLDRTRFGGGVAIYIKNTIPYFERRDLVPDNLEMICVDKFLVRLHGEYNILV